MNRIESLLWIEDQTDFVDSLVLVLQQFCPHVIHVRTIEDARAKLETTSYDVVLLDLQLESGTWGGLEFLRTHEDLAAAVPIVVLSGAGTMTECIEAIRLGAKDYVQKERARSEIMPVVTKVVEEFRAQQPLADYARLRHVERTLKALVFAALKSAADRNGQDVFKSYIPKSVALKSYERWLEAKAGNQEDFLDLLDLADILDKQWNNHHEFQVLGKVINPKSGKERTRWLTELNEARKFVAHPARGDVGTEERKALQRAEDIIAKWKEGVAKNG